MSITNYYVTWIVIKVGVRHIGLGQDIEGVDIICVGHYGAIAVYGIWLDNVIREAVNNGIKPVQVYMDYNNSIIKENWILTVISIVVKVEKTFLSENILKPNLVSNYI